MALFGVVTRLMTGSKIIGLSGSLRAGSFNTALLMETARLAPDDVDIEVIVPGDIPLYSADVEAGGMPSAVADLRRKVTEADALLLATPEYNFSVSGVMKNAIDWLSRGGVSSPLHHKATGILSAAGGSGGSHALKHLRQMLSHNRVRTLAEPEVRLRRGSAYFTNGRLTDLGTEIEIVELIDRVLELASVPPNAPDVHGSVFVIGSEVDSADRIAALIAERGVRALTALTRTDAGRVLSSRNIAAVVLDPTLAVEEADLLEKEINELRPDTPVLRPATAEACPDDVVAAMQELTAL